MELDPYVVSSQYVSFYLYQSLGRKKNVLNYHSYKFFSEFGFWRKVQKNIMHEKKKLLWQYYLTIGTELYGNVSRIFFSLLDASFQKIFTHITDFIKRKLFSLSHLVRIFRSLPLIFAYDDSIYQDLPQALLLLLRVGNKKKQFVLASNYLLVMCFVFEFVRKYLCIKHYLSLIGMYNHSFLSAKHDK